MNTDAPTPASEAPALTRKIAEEIAVAIETDSPEPLAAIISRHLAPLEAELHKYRIQGETLDLRLNEFGEYVGRSMGPEFHGLIIRVQNEIASLRTRLTAAELALSEAKKEGEAKGAKLHAINIAVDGYVDGAPDCNSVSKLANEVSLIINPPTYP